MLGKAGASSPQSDSIARYFPFGDWRTEPVQMATNMGYTGHRHNNLAANDLGLIYMNARYYLPGLGRFASPDTLVPDPANPQAFNRYGYTLNNPLQYADPSGHCPNPASNEYGGPATNIICVAFFIPTAESNIPLLLGPNYIGDDRDFSSDSDVDASRAWVWIDVDTGQTIGQRIHETCNTWGQCAGPVDDKGIYKNTIASKLDEDGNVHLTYNIRCAGLRCGMAPGPSGEISFIKRDDGSFTSKGDINAFPNAEAYFYDSLDAQAETLFRFRFVSQDEIKAGIASFIGSTKGMLGINQFAWDYTGNRRIGGY